MYILLDTPGGGVGHMNIQSDSMLWYESRNVMTDVLCVVPKIFEGLYRICSVAYHLISFKVYPPVSPGQEDGPNNPREQLLGRSTGGYRNIHIGWCGGMIQECWSVVPKIQVVANCYDKQKRSWRALISNFDVEEGRQSQLIPNVQLGPVSVKKVWEWACWNNL